MDEKLYLLCELRLNLLFSLNEDLFYKTLNVLLKNEDYVQKSLEYFPTDEEVEQTEIPEGFYERLAERLGIEIDDMEGDSYG